MSVFSSRVISRNLPLWWLVAGISLMGCREKKPAPAETDSPTSGTISIICDESFAPLIRNEISTFTAIYPQAQVLATFVPEADAVDRFFASDSFRLLLIPRRMMEAEKQYFSSKGLPSHEIKIAIDALAIVVHPSNPDSQLLFRQVAALLDGSLSTWKQVNSSSPLDSVVLVFDNRRSSTVRYMSEMLPGNTLGSRNAFAVDSNPAVIDYISRHENAAGFIGMNWISDRDDTTSGKFLSGIKPLAVSRNDTIQGFFLPVKKNLYSMHYPFLRELFIVSREARTGLGTGFATYVASDEGQRIVQRNGLMPADGALRMIEIRKEF